MLELKGLSKHFGGVRAVDGLDLRVTQGEVFGLIGPNGSGKSTVVNLVCGLFPVTAGQVLLRNEDITSLASHVRVACGVTRTFQNIRLFGQLSVWQNLWVAQNAVEHRSEGFLRRWLRAARARKLTGSSSFPICRASATNSRVISRSANSAASNSPALSLQSRPCCCSTSRPRE